MLKIAKIIRNVDILKKKWLLKFFIAIFIFFFFRSIVSIFNEALAEPIAYFTSVFSVLFNVSSWLANNLSEIIAYLISDGEKMTMGGRGGYINNDTRCLSLDKINEKPLILNRNGTPPSEDGISGPLVNGDNSTEGAQNITPSGPLSSDPPLVNGESESESASNPEINKFWPQDDEPWPQGMTIDELDTEYKRQQGYYSDDDNKLDVYKPGVTADYESTGTLTDECSLQPMGNNISNLLQDLHNEYIANGGDPEIPPAIPYDDFKDNLQATICTTIYTNLSDESVNDNTEEIRELFRNLGN